MGKKEKGGIWIDRALVLSPLHVALCTTEDQFKKELDGLRLPLRDQPKFISNDYSDATTHFFTKDGDNCCIVCIRHKKGVLAHQVYALLCHEAVHVWQEAREMIGENNPGSEFEAYSIQRIFQSLMEAYRDLKK